MPYAIVLAGIALVALAPVLSVVLAGAIANANGCTVDEGSVHACVVGGREMGETLYTMFVAGWLMFITLPAGALAFLVWLGAVTIHVLARRQKRRALLSTVATAACMFAFFGWTAHGEPPGGKTMMHAKGPFEVKLSPQATDAPLGRMSIDKQFHGDLEATSKGEMLAAQSVVKGSAGYVAIEQVTGTLQGRHGTFFLQHSGTMDRSVAQLTVTVIPDSGTDELEGLAGKMSIDIADGKHLYDFEYTLPEKR